MWVRLAHVTPHATAAVIRTIGGAVFVPSEPMTSIATPVIKVGDRQYPVVLPTLRDPRLHTAAVIISIHTLGVAFLGFRVSVPQILTAIGVSAAVEIAFAFVRSGALVWPASGMLTGSGVALILRVTDMPRGEPWSWHGWHWYALVAGASVLSKYMIRGRDGHVFNPSNLGLVVAFLVLGREVIEPLDFWWAPLDFPMLLAYLIIVAGGVLITSRLRLLGMVATFWAALALALGVLILPGHCMNATWSLDPVCGGRFWSTLVTSPEVLVFMFFMLTDPKTIPRDRSARIWFAASVALLATLLIAPQTTEFGAKVGLLSGLVLLSPLRGLIDREGSRHRERHLATTPRPLGVGVAAAIFGLVMLGSIFIAGVPARLPTLDSFSASATEVPNAETTVPGGSTQAEIDVEIDPDAIPKVTVDANVAALDSDAIDRAPELARMFLEDLEIERRALVARDLEMLRAASSGQRYLDLEEIIRVGDGGNVEAPAYIVDTLHLGVVRARSGQSVALGFDATGTVEITTYAPDGAELGTRTAPFSSTFLVRRLGGDRWRIVQVMPDGDA